MSEREHKSRLRETSYVGASRVGRPSKEKDPAVAARVKKLREDLGLYLWEVATKLDPPVWPQSLYKWENGTVGITRDRLEQLAKFYNVTVDSLLGQEKHGPEGNQGPKGLRSGARAPGGRAKGNRRAT